MRALAVLLLLSAGGVMLAAYWNLPDASVCAQINQVNESLGGAPTCSSTPAAGYQVAAAVPAVAAVVAFVVGQARAARRI
jgi:hypothetical protein